MAWEKTPPSFLFLLLLSHLGFRGRPHSALHYSKAPLAATWKGEKFPVGYSIALHHGNGTQIATKIYALHALLHNSSFSKFFLKLCGYKFWKTVQIQEKNSLVGGTTDMEKDAAEKKDPK